MTDYDKIIDAIEKVLYDHYETGMICFDEPAKAAFQAIEDAGFVVVDKELQVLQILKLCDMPTNDAGMKWAESHLIEAGKVGRGVIMEYSCKDHNDHGAPKHSYIGWFEWAEEKGRTHKQVRCSQCGKFKVWVPKPPQKPSEE